MRLRFIKYFIISMVPVNVTDRNGNITSSSFLTRGSVKQFFFELVSHCKEIVAQA